MKSNTKQMTTTALMLALATVLSMVNIIKLPNGGGVTAASMVPIIIISLIYKPLWGIFAALIYSLLQMLFGGIAAPPAPNFTSYLLVILLDYVVAFGVLGLGGAFYRLFNKKSWSIPFSAGIVVFLRFICHFLSGILIWGIYAPEGQTVAYYSLAYNGSYMSIELLVTVIVITALIKVIEKNIE